MPNGFGGRRTGNLASAMTQDSSRGSSAPIAVVDIGSNSIRLVIYASGGRYPFPLFNERANSRLGEGLDLDGRLQVERISVALTTLSRFREIMKAMGVVNIHAVATAAVRRAANADEFTTPAQAVLGQSIEVLSQQDEAHYVSRGLILNIPAATGLVADLGGGSLEVVALENGTIRHAASFNFGHLSSLTRDDVMATMDGEPWIAGGGHQRIYGVGGSFRALGLAYIEQTGYPLAVLHGLQIKAGEAAKILGAFCHDPPDLSGIPLGRKRTMPVAALIMRALLDHSRARKIEISGTSIRDGIIADMELDASDRADFLQVVCQEISHASHRFSGVPEALARLLGPLFMQGDEDRNGGGSNGARTNGAKGKTPGKGAAGGNAGDASGAGGATRQAEVARAKARFTRLLDAACRLSDMCWNEHVDVRGDVGARRVLGLPVNCITHKERIWLATAIYHRYVGRKTNKSRPPELSFILGRRLRAEATTIGLGLRFALIFSGGTASSLDALRLTNEGGTLTLHVDKGIAPLLDSHAERRFQQLAQSANLVPHIAL